MSAALGLAVAVKAHAARNRTIDTLRRSMASTGLRLPSIMANPPTIGAPTTATAIAVGTTWLYNSHALQIPVRYTLLGGTATLPTGFPGGELVSITSVTSTGTTRVPAGGRIRFTSYAPAFEILFMGGSGKMRIKVDGEYVSTTSFGVPGQPLSPSGAIANGVYPYFLPIQWGDGSASQRKLRRYELEMSSNGNVYFAGLRASNLYPPSPWPVEDHVRVIVHGDSIVEGAGDDPHGTVGNALGNMLGQPDTWASGSGGTGYIASLGGTKHTFIQRVQADIIAPAPDFIFECGGLNDTANPQTTIQAKVEEWLAAVTSALPAVTIFMAGPLVPNDTASAAIVACRDAKKAAAAVFSKNTFFLDNIADKWVTGNGKATTPNGTGNADWITSGDSVHPTLEGSVYHASRLAAGAAAVLNR
jgi:lysophospholipase L1-like esterase